MTPVLSYEREGTGEVGQISYTGWEQKKVLPKVVLLTRGESPTDEMLKIIIIILLYILRNCHIIILCDVGGGAPLAWYESRGTGRCFSFPIVLPVPEGSPHPVNWSGL